ncbi:guanylate kinase [uncultured Desulfuromonas sp.]|uniref:guanylate kinase n=1 Tax=uncultured Desulfuromonas sp. TaxID=181013 RepID=UPI002630F2AA|nr:guanylate kinase [uncultured Desulfuromonas sp.]
MKRNGIVFVVSAPSGAGKTTLCKELIDLFPRLRHSVSYTTRPRRQGERDGSDYHFVTAERFSAMVAAGEFAEWAEVHGNCYGTAIQTLDDWRAAGEDVLLEIDCQGAAQLKRTCPGAVFVFILPPGFAELRQRLEGRDTDAPEVIERRIANASIEVREAAWYDYVVVNDELPRALEELKGIVVAEGARARRVLPGVAEEFRIPLPAADSGGQGSQP